MAEKRKTQKETVFKVDGDQVIETEVQEKEIEVGTVTEDGTARVQFELGDGRVAVYKYAGDCWDCQNKRPPIKTEVFECESYPIQADERLGNQLAAFWREGREGKPLCLECLNKRLKDINRPEARVRSVGRT